MQLEKQVCNSSLARRLRELRVKQESEYEWEVDKATKKRALKTSGIRGCARCGAVINGIPRPTIYTDRYAAFTVAELGEMLPHKKNYYYEMENDGVAPWLFRLMQNSQLLEELQGDTEADARAKMLIYLLENKLLSTAAQSNERDRL